jgi:hypothetical protein
VRSAPELSREGSFFESVIADQAMLNPTGGPSTSDQLAVSLTAADRDELRRLLEQLLDGA